MSEYKIIESNVTGEIRVSRHSQYNDLSADSVTVEENVTARLFGTIKGKLIIHKGAKVYLHGTVGGDVQNKGGEFYQY